jgi:hypothetical protein
MVPIYHLTTGISTTPALLTYKYAALPASCAQGAKKAGSPHKSILKKDLISHKTTKITKGAMVPAPPLLCGSVPLLELNSVAGEAEPGFICGFINSVTSVSSAAVSVFYTRVYLCRRNEPFGRICLDREYA